MLQNCKIIDTTLREGEQAPGVLLTVSEKKHIIDKLADIGLHEVELGIASPLATCLPELIAYCRENHPDLQLSLWSRCRDEDILYAASLGPDIISLSLPVSDLHLKEKLGKDRGWALKTLQRSLKTAERLGLTAAVGFEDATRADHAFLELLSHTAEEGGACRIRLADTVGICSPGTMGTLVRRLGSGLRSAELAVHTHNDFGMAVANAISALENGAIWADATVLGLGERCGCARLEELVGWLHLIGGHAGFRVEGLGPLARLLADSIGMRIPSNRPLLGEGIFTCETGLHLQGLQNNPATYEPYAPERVGLERKLLYGAKTGRRALASHLRSQGSPLADDRRLLFQKVTELRSTAQQMGRALSEGELTALLSDPTAH